MVLAVEVKQKCSRCGSEVVLPGHSLCEDCAKLARQRRMALYNQRLNTGLCPGCGGKRDLPGVQCSTCRSMNNKSRESIPTKKKTHYQNSYLARNRKRGLCPSCGGYREDKMHVYCPKCRKRARNRRDKDPAGWKFNAITRGYIKPRPPKPTCDICGYQHKSCEKCGKMMHIVHGRQSCEITCKCGNHITYLKEGGKECQTKLVLI